MYSHHCKHLYMMQFPIRMELTCFCRTFIKGCILMFVVVSIPVTGQKHPTPSELVKDIFTFIGPELNLYVSAQFQLEEIGDDAELYNLPEHQRIIVEKELLESPKVQELIKKCEEYPTQLNCNMSMYRTYDGTCNNMKHPLWGSSNYMMDRYLPAAYEGIKGYRKSVNGEDLPHPRNLSLNLINVDNPTTGVSAFFTYFGQFISHDVSLAPTFTKLGGDPCESPESKVSKACDHVHIREDDPFYKQFNITILGFSRTAPYPKCNFEKRTPINQETSLLDASNIYGYNESVANGLRLKDGSGKLRSQNTIHGELLPANSIQDLVFCPRIQTTICFSAGDERVNQHVLLTTMHIVFMRFHNNIADKLHAMNPKWDEEKLYQEAKRIVTAVYQFTIYDEYLPLLVGNRLMNVLRLFADENSLYNDKVNPGGLVEFTTGSFRLHSMIPKTFSKNHPDMRFNEIYFRPSLIHDGETESLLNGSCEVPSEKSDRYLIEDIDNYLYRPPGAHLGIDLTILDVQRERDHGIPGYIDVLRKCSNEEIEIRQFSDLKQIMPDENVRLLQSMYQNVLDIDLIIGLYMEYIYQDSQTGFTSACLSAEQFRRLKFGDSFFFSHTNSRYPFTNEQLKSIRSFTLAQLICQAGGFTSIRRYPLLMPSYDNYMIDCQSAPLLDLEPWKDSSAAKVTDDSSSKKNDASLLNTPISYLLIFPCMCFVTFISFVFK